MKCKMEIVKEEDNYTIEKDEINIKNRSEYQMLYYNYLEINNFFYKIYKDCKKFKKTEILEVNYYSVSFIFKIFD